MQRLAGGKLIVQDQLQPRRGRDQTATSRFRRRQRPGGRCLAPSCSSVAVEDSATQAMEVRNVSEAGSDAQRKVVAKKSHPSKGVELRGIFASAIPLRISLQAGSKVPAPLEHRFQSIRDLPSSSARVAALTHFLASLPDCSPARGSRPQDPEGACWTATRSQSHP
jgi:hypothetical protein